MSQKEALKKAVRTSKVKEVTGMVFDVKHYMVHDGPGIRTVVFLKGCPQRCLWCHSPESQIMEPEIAFFENLCIACQECVKVCPHKAQTMEKYKIRRDLCERCGKCVEECYAGALIKIGEIKTVDEVMKELEKDDLLYKNSGGGITISGGEPLLQPKFTLELLKRCKQQKKYHTAIETCGNMSWKTFDEILDYVDLVLYDLKHMDSATHKELTGLPNKLILDNLKRLSDRGKPPFVIRVPLIPGYNDSNDNIEAMARFLSKLKNVGDIEILPYHVLGVSKYQSIGKEYKLHHVKPPEQEKLKDIKKRMEVHGLHIILEGLS